MDLIPDLSPIEEGAKYAQYSDPLLMRYHSSDIHRGGGIRVQYIHKYSVPDDRIMGRYTLDGDTREPELCRLIPPHAHATRTISYKKVRKIYTYLLLIPRNPHDKKRDRSLSCCRFSRISHRKVLSLKSGIYRTSSHCSFSVFDGVL